MNAFHFQVTDSFLIEGRGLIVAPFFPVDEFQLEGTKQIRVQRPDGSSFEATADFEIPFISPTPKIFEAVCLIRGVEKEDVPIGSEIFLTGESE